MLTSQILCGAAQVEVGFKLEDQRGPASEWIALDSVQVRPSAVPSPLRFHQSPLGHRPHACQMRSPAAGRQLSWAGWRNLCPQHLGDCGTLWEECKSNGRVAGSPAAALVIAARAAYKSLLSWGFRRFCLRACLHLLCRVCAQRAISKRFRTFLLSFAVEKEGARHYRDAIRDMCRGRSESREASLFWHADALSECF